MEWRAGFRGVSRCSGAGRGLVGENWHRAMSCRRSASSEEGAAHPTGAGCEADARNTSCALAGALSMGITQSAANGERICQLSPPAAGRESCVPENGEPPSQRVGVLGYVDPRQVTGSFGSAPRCVAHIREQSIEKRPVTRSGTRWNVIRAALFVREQHPLSSG